MAAPRALQGGPSLALGLLLLLGVCYAALAPAEINGDGVGYLKQVPGSSLSPGHLAYLPLLRLIAAVWPHRTLIELVLPFRLLSLACALGAVALVYAAGRRLYGQTTHAIFGAALLGVSQAFAWSASQVEVYAPATLVVAAILWALTLHAGGAASGGPRTGPAALAGLLAALAVSLHLTLVLLCPAVLVLVARQAPAGRRLRHVAAAALVGGVAGAVLLLAALALVGLTEPGAIWTWLRGADHGIPYPHSWRTPLVALWGIARSLVHAPYPHEAPLWRVAVQTALAGSCWIALFVLRRRVRPPGPVGSGSPGDLAALALWSAPLALFAAAFFPSDTERWIFSMPALALYLAPCASRAGWALVAVVLLVNLLAGQLPAALNRAPAERAAAVERLVPAHALIVSPGHGWDELIGLGTPRPIERYPLIYFVGAERSRTRAVRRMHATIRRTLSRGDAVFVARLRDPIDARGFKELDWSGLTRPSFARLFDAYRPRPTAVEGLWALDRPGAGAASSPP